MKPVNGFFFYQRHGTLLLRSVFAVRMFFQIETCPCKSEVKVSSIFFFLFDPPLNDFTYNNACVPDEPLHSKLACYETKLCP